MNNKEILGALALDLKRVALSYHRGSFRVAERFLQEALKRRSELELSILKPSLQKILSKLETINNKEHAEDALMYSTLFQNAALHS